MKIKDRLDRLSVIWCIRDGRPLEALKDIEHKLILSEFVPEYAASNTSHVNLGTSLYDDAKTFLVAKLKSMRDELQKAVYSGPFCSLQLDLTSIGNDEFCTASLSVILPDKQAAPSHLNLATKVFRGKHTKVTIKRWIEELATEFSGRSSPECGHVICTLRPPSTKGATSLTPAWLWASRRCNVFNSAVMWTAGINGTASTCKNKDGRELISRYAALVGMFSHSCTNSDAFRAMQNAMHAKEAEQMEQFRIAATDIEESSDAAPLEGLESGLPKSLAFITRNDTRWTSLFSFLERLGISRKWSWSF